MFEHNIAFNGMMIVIVILSYLLFKSLKSKKRLQHKYDEVFKAFHIANSEYTGGLKEVYKNLSLSNAQLQFLAVYLNQDTVQFDDRNIVCEKEDDVQYILSLISDSHFWLDKSMKGIAENNASHLGEKALGVQAQSPAAGSPDGIQSPGESELSTVLHR